jgi:DNA-binding transcriptional LysR family regulator
VQINWLQTFIAVAEDLHFGRAARRLHLAQPAVSQQIQSLEKAVGTRLFDRDRRSVRLTDAGSAFLGPCREVLGGLGAAIQQARNAGTGEFGHLRVGYNAAFAPDALVDLIRLVGREYPHLELEVDESRTNAEILRLLEEGELDFGLLGGPVVGKTLAWHTLTTVHLGVLLPADHPLADGPGVSMAQLRDESFILLRPAPGRTLRRLVEEECERAGYQPRRIVEVRDGLSVLPLIASGIGVGFGVDSALTVLPGQLRLLPITDSALTEVHIVWKAQEVTPALSKVLDLARRPPSPRP